MLGGILVFGVFWALLTMRRCQPTKADSTRMSFILYHLGETVPASASTRGNQPASIQQLPDRRAAARSCFLGILVSGIYPTVACCQS
jgi:hypothetical protein